jgi:hypothetical protein
MGTLTIESFTGTVKSAEEMLALWQKAESDIATVGQTYFAPGGVQYTFADLEEVHKMVMYWEKRVLSKRGVTGRNTADIAGGTSEKAATL